MGCVVPGRQGAARGAWRVWPVDVTVRAGSGLPRPEGAQALAWGLLLDRIFADAFHAGVATLTFVLPRPELAEAVQVRAELTAPQAEARDLGVACLAGEPFVVAGAVRLYTLESSRPASPAWRRALPPLQPLTGWRLDGATGLYGWGPRLLGVPVRLAAVLRHPRSADAAMRAVREGFERQGTGPATFRLKVWRPA